MTDIKLIAVDLDGTALNSTGEMSPYTLQVLKGLATKDIKLVIATGRPLYQTKHIVTKLGLTDANDFTVSLNGSVVANNATEEILFCDYFDPQLLRELYTDVLAFDLDTLIMFDADHSSFNKMLLHCKGFEDKMTKHYLSSFTEVQDEVTACLYTNNFNVNVNKIYISSYTSDINRLVAKWKDKIEISQEIRGDRSALEVTSRHINKASGIAQICQKYQLKAKNVMAFGNEHNDVAMLQWAGIGVAMGNAPDDVKGIANLVAEDNDHDGIAKVIETIVFGA
ncbi:Cof-type HAD-IIB family hydrolase [Spiroplasma sp. SV19]|uniref:Cof-type HAD-IIB family hydrolase n=1 Tax=Spiroplasma sp. SV19 TaxID=2570468 RepID=UPI0024B71E00|nr:Cof-type HAD-IIB family hydrolase [Spiroplasma sp. SV19]WHQ37458.1 Cof-type HAD-IIB family hydrolase [Spiroplasma sp. SV19]